MTFQEAVLSQDNEDFYTADFGERSGEFQLNLDV